MAARARTTRGQITRDQSTRTQTMVQLTNDLVHRLDDEAIRRGLSRSAIIREAVERYLAAQGDSALTARLVKAYQDVPQAEPDPWGSVVDLADQTTAQTLIRLDQEERRSGTGPW